MSKPRVGFTMTGVIFNSVMSRSATGYEECKIVQSSVTGLSDSDAIIGFDCQLYHASTVDRSVISMAYILLQWISGPVPNPFMAIAVILTIFNFRRRLHPYSFLMSTVYYIFDDGFKSSCEAPEGIKNKEFIPKIFGSDITPFDVRKIALSLGGEDYRDGDTVTSATTAENRLLLKDGRGNRNIDYKSMSKSISSICVISIHNVSPHNVRV